MATINNKIFDPIRKKEVTLTKEEEVRQGFCRFLIEEMHYPLPNIENECMVKVGERALRCDTLVSYKLRPAMLIEYKAKDVEINATVYNQVVQYNQEIKAPYVVITNSVATYCLYFDFINGTCNYVNAIPTFDTLKEEINRLMEE